MNKKASIFSASSPKREKSYENSSIPNSSSQINFEINSNEKSKKSGNTLHADPFHNSIKNIEGNISQNIKNIDDILRNKKFIPLPKKNFMRKSPTSIRENFYKKTNFMEKIRSNQKLAIKVNSFFKGEKTNINKFNQNYI